MTSFRIIGIKRRNRIARFFSIAQWLVTVQLDNGAIHTVTAWAGLNKPRLDYLVDSVQAKVRKLQTPMQSLVGQVFSTEEFYLGKLPKKEASK